MKVWIAIHEHKYGNDVRVFDAFHKVEQWRAEIAQENWEELDLGTLMFDVDVFWDNIEEQWFWYREQEVE